MKQISVALTHFNRFGYLLECIIQVINDPRIGEIVISDDASTDGSYELLQSHFASISKVKLFRNEQNLDCYRNKQKAVSHTTFDWVILFDSDNILTPAYLNRIYAENWENDVVYCPDFAEPHFDYSLYAGQMIDRTNVASFMDRDAAKNGHPPFHHRRLRPVVARAKCCTFSTALNTCNYFVHRENYLSVWDGSVDPHTADSIFQAFNWLKAGKRLVILPGLRYFHRVHQDSHYKLNCHKTGKFHHEVEDKLRQLR